MSLIRILYIEQVSFFLGGGQVSLLELIANIDRNRYHPVVVVNEPGPLSEQLIAQGATVYFINITRIKGMGLFKLPYYLWRIAAIIRREQIQIIHNAVPRLVCIAGIIGKILKVPQIWHVRVAEKDGLFDRFNGWLATQMIANSKAVQRRFDRYATSVAQKITVIPNGIDLKKFNPTQLSPSFRTHFLATHQISEDAILIGTLSQLSPIKDHETMIRAAAYLIHRDPKIHLIVPGEEITSGYLAKLTHLCHEMAILKNVHFIGFCNDPVNLLALFRVFILSSRNEGFGRVLAEAMAMERPIIATHVGGIPEIVINGQTGILVPPGNPVAMARQIQSCLQKPKLSEAMGIAGRERVMDHFTIESHIAQVDQIYHMVLQPKK